MSVFGLYLNPSDTVLSLCLTWFLQERECVDNDECTTANIINELPYIDDSSNEMSSPHEDDGSSTGTSSCYGLQSGSRTNWYVMEGQDSCVSAVVAATNFYPYIGVYSGPECTTMTCVAQESYGGNKVSFFAENGTTYRIAVGGEYSSQSGDYTLTVLVSAVLYLCCEDVCLGIGIGTVCSQEAVCLEIFSHDCLYPFLPFWPNQGVR